MKALLLLFFVSLASCSLSTIKNQDLSGDIKRAKDVINQHFQLVQKNERERETALWINDKHIAEEQKLEHDLDSTFGKAFQYEMFFYTGDNKTENGFEYHYIDVVYKVHRTKAIIEENFSLEMFDDSLKIKKHTLGKKLTR